MDENPIVLTDEQMVEDIASRMETFRAGMNDLVQTTGIFPDVAMDERDNRVGLVLKDRKHNRDDLNELGRKAALQKFRDTQDATPLPDPTPEEQAELQEFLAAATEGEGDPIPPAPPTYDDPTKTEGSTA